jgi:hypothetical protein
MPPFGFVGPAFKHPQSVIGSEECRNWIPELTSGGQSKTDLGYVARPGLLQKFTAGVGPWRGFIEANGRFFIVSGPDLYELNSNWTVTLRGTAGQLVDDGKPASLAYNGPQVGEIAIASAGVGFIFNLGANTLTAIADPQFPANVIQVVFWKGHFVWLTRNGVTFHLSDLYVGTSYATVDIGEKSNTGDYINSLLVDEDVGELWLRGVQRSEVWRYTAAPGFPAEPVDVVIPSGSPATFGSCLLRGTVYSLSQSGGSRVVERFQSYGPQRISTHAVDAALKSYTETQIANAQAYAIEWRGHSFFVLQFVSPGVTWVYDELTDLWTNWDHWDTGLGQSEAFLGLGCIAAFGRQLLGSHSDGLVYDFSESYLDDDGDVIRIVRAAPPVGKNRTHHTLTFDFQMGVGTATVPAPVGSVDWSDDDGKTWSTPLEITLGAQGDFDNVAQLRRLGKSGHKGRVYRLVITSSVVRALSGADLVMGRAA